MAEDPTVATDELSEHGGQPCPERLPIDRDESGHGFGVDEAADRLPSLLEPEEAWVCEYSATDVGRTDQGALFAWDRVGNPVALDVGSVADIAQVLDGLTLPEPERVCTADLGPRLMFAYAHRGDLTAVVIDEYGCRNVRLTDDPFETPIGEADGAGVVPGVLHGPPELFRLLDAALRG